jgi:hypothetical protein
MDIQTEKIEMPYPIKSWLENGFFQGSSDFTSDQAHKLLIVVIGERFLVKKKQTKYTSS